MNLLSIHLRALVMNSVFAAIFEALDVRVVTLDDCFAGWSSAWSFVRNDVRRVGRIFSCWHFVMLPTVP